jgi:hypothetical protein
LANQTNKSKGSRENSIFVDGSAEEKAKTPCIVLATGKQTQKEAKKSRARVGLIK